jgi:hypothetical protein
VRSLSNYEGTPGASPLGSDSRHASNSKTAVSAPAAQRKRLWPALLDRSPRRTLKINTHATAATDCSRIVNPQTPIATADCEADERATLDGDLTHEQRDNDREVRGDVAHE